MGEPTPEQQNEAMVIRAASEAFVDQMATALIDQGISDTHEAAFREIAIQSTFNAGVMFRALPEGMRHIFADSLRGLSDG